MAIELPLFPLNVVLFPGAELPLYIFEPRYCLMINECHEQHRPFGIVLARSESKPLLEEPHSIGTMAEIEELSHLENGRMTLIARGNQRFHILSTHRKRPYLSGIIETYDDAIEDAEPLEAANRQARELFHAYVETLLTAVDSEQATFTLPDGAEDLSHSIAHLINVSDEQKQHMLELTSTTRRLEDEITFLRRELPFMREILNMSQRFHTDKTDHSMLN